ncbi:MAG TPA: ABC transporter permease, partial [Chitinophagaceae bacterium]|nr:ABC transporter permease [Chitinophagaceae bacterium]
IALRKVLVVGQFAITVALIIGSFVVYKQVRFMNRQSLGMNIDQMLIIKPPMLMGFDSSFIQRVNSFKQAAEQIPGVAGAASISTEAGRELSRAFDVHRTDDASGNHYTVRNMGADADFLSVYGIKLLSGRNFTSLDYNADFRKLHNLLLNEAAVKQLGFTSNSDAVGKQVFLFGGNWTVIGIINNFHQKSLRYPMEPTLILPTYGTYNPISIKVNAANVANTIAAIKTKYNQYFPGNLFDYFFLDERFKQQYADDQLFGKAFGIFAGFAICIACLGLLGLSLFATLQRTKEIGVRKVLGASVSNIVLLLSKDFIKLVLVAFVIASPVAYYIMHQWLQDFAYRINIEWWVFAIAGMLAVFIALATISYQAIKAAVTNPVKSLRTE